MKAKLKLKTGMILTIVIEKEDNKFLEGVDKFGEKVKLEKEDILSRVPIH